MDIFFTYICCKNCNVCFKRPKINEKDAGVGPVDVAQLVEWSLLTPEVHSSNPVIGKFYIERYCRLY